VGVALLAAALFFAVSAHAAWAGDGNRVLNPGMEGACAPGPASWGAAGGSTVGCSATAHSGSQSLALSNSGGSFMTALASCVTSIGSGNYATSFWYRSAVATISRVSVKFTPYSGASCSTPAGSSFTVDTLSPLNDSAWHQVSGTIAFPSGTNSAWVELYFCGSACGLNSPSTVLYDDFSLDVASAPPTVAGGLGFRAARAGGGVWLAWRSSGRADVLGYRVLRSDTRTGVYRRLAVLAARGPGAAYGFVDRRRAGGWYRLELLLADGTTVSVAAVRARAS
jgi:hypothetical protein